MAPATEGSTGGPTRALVPAAAQAPGGHVITPSSTGAIAGRILKEGNTPVAGATIEALVPRTEHGQPTLAIVATTDSDDRGDFRLTGLAAGQYYIRASDAAVAQARDEDGSPRYLPTYFPGVVSPEEAMRVMVTRGVEPAGAVTFLMKVVRPARISGQLTAGGRQLLSAAMVMTRADPMLPSATADVVMLPDGSFSFRNVSPGIYEIRARGELTRGGTTHFATFRVRVEGQDVSDLRLDMSPGAIVTGTLVFAGARSARPASPAGIRVRAPLADGRTFGDALTGEVQPNGTYAIRGVMPGRHTLTLEGLPSPWVLESVTLRGQDITDVGIEAEAGGRFENVAIVVTDVSTELSGVVRDAEGRTVQQALVLVIPLAQQFWHRTSRRFGVLRTGADGRFAIRGLPVGEYRVVASLDLDDMDTFRLPVLERFSEAGLPLSLDAQRARELEVPLTPMVSSASSR